MKRVRALIVKTQAINGIDGEELHSAGVDEIRQSADHALAFEFEFVAGAGGKAEQRWPPMSVNDNAELHAEPRRVPAVNFTFHPLPLVNCGVRKYASVTPQGQSLWTGIPTVVSIPRLLR